ncbi:MAG TPA: hypothetical protein VLJ16_05800 [Acidobacteriota bacterium]|nr:hypothetical protein [Acidobacteriota bacterium]
MRCFRALVLALALVLAVAVPTPAAPKRPPAELAPGLRDKLARYIEAKGLAPEEYVASKFADHDIVFLGEHHFIKHDPEFVAALIPVIYRRGVTDLGIEYGCYELQAEADALVTAERYDEARARRLLFQWGSYWPYVEYLGLYRAAWELNRSLPPGAPKFRIIGLDYRPRWDRLEEKMSRRQLVKRVFFKGGRDRHMAEVVTREFVRKGRKALIYAGQYHASTRFPFPVYDFRKRMVTGFDAQTMGQVINRKIRGRAFNICLHYPWETVDGPKSFDYPIGGAVDALMKGLGPRPVGFDVVGSPFGRLTDHKAVYSRGRPKFFFEDFCDGYIFQKPFAEYEGCAVDPLFITDENLAEAIAFLPNAGIRKKIVNKAQFLAKFRWDADFKRLYPDLE